MTDEIDLSSLDALTQNPARVMAAYWRAAGYEIDEEAFEKVAKMLDAPATTS